MSATVPWMQLLLAACAVHCAHEPFICRYATHLHDTLVELVQDPSEDVRLLIASSLQQVAAVLGKDRCIQYLKRCGGMPVAAWAPVRCCAAAVAASAQLWASAPGVLLVSLSGLLLMRVQCCLFRGPCSFTGVCPTLQAIPQSFRGRMPSCEE